ncbi:MAG TPA: aminopeptidase P N-terminal domain-containing protein [Blastocatellia bacterium]|nr:aminopeptidase P N-terminal domain-containing protein [Blastocatellia bacterium]
MSRNHDPMTDSKPSKEDLQRRREEFMKRIPAGGAIFPSTPTAIRNGDVDHEYRQNGDLYYLTGFEEPNSLAVLIPDHPETRFVMFVQPKDPERETWTGKRAGDEGAVRDYGADKSFTIDKLNEELPGLLQKVERIYYRFGIDASIDDRVVALMRRFSRERQRNGVGPYAVVDPADVLHSMRLVKSDEELRRLRRAVDISCDGHIAAMRETKPGVHEYELEAVLRYIFTRSGSPRCGYPPIVASGPNATTLHYVENRRRVADDDLVLIDAGAEFGYYTGDVTRTFPASGTFTKPQAEIYEIVLEANRQAIGEVRPGSQFNDPHARAAAVITEGLLRLGLLEGDLETLIKEEGFKKYYMHRTSHWLGMDVHDVGSYKTGDNWTRLEPGMVLTVEPGIYIAENAEAVPDRYRGIGVRIEDDVLVTGTGSEVLSARVPKTPDDLMAIVGSSK